MVKVRTLRSGPVNRRSTKRGEDEKHQRQKRNSQTYRDKLKNDEVARDKYLRKDRERKKKSRENAKPLTEREKRQKQRKNREYMRQYRLKKKAKEDDECLSGIDDLPPLNNSELDGEKEALSKSCQTDFPLDLNGNYSGFDFSNAQSMPSNRGEDRTKLRKLRYKFEKDKKMLQEEMHKCQQKVWTLQKRETRKRKLLHTPTKVTPKRKLQRLTEGKFVGRSVKRQLLKGLVIEEECKQLKAKVEREKKTEGRNVWSKFFCGKVLKKYKLLSKCQHILPGVKCARIGRKWVNGFSYKSLRVQYRSSESSLKRKNAVVDFLSSDKASHFAPGKKDYVKINTEKHQKRYLNDTMSKLYSQFLVVSPYAVSFAYFCRNKPAYIVPPKYSGRDTCLCTKCDNFKLFTASLISANVFVSAKSKDDIIQSVVCDTGNVECLLRNCKLCKSRTLKFNTKGKGKVNYQKWVTKIVANRNKGGKAMKICEKEKLEISVGAAVKSFRELLPLYISHIGRVLQQRNEWNHLLENLGENDLAVIMDWSESYECKYHREVQGMHFGGSHKKISLHTGRVYQKNSSQSFCTVSEDTSHGPQGIFAHVKPILEKFVTKDIKNLHFQSDGPSSQYRSSKMFHVVTKWITEQFPHVYCIFWNFSEAGHGKSVADGVGGTVKRTADAVIKYGGDVMDVTTFVQCVGERCPSILILEITAAEMEDALHREIPLFSKFKGTMQVHQYYWTLDRPSEIIFKTLSCYRCGYSSKSVCTHFTLGKPWVMVRQESAVPKRKCDSRSASQKQTGPKQVVKKAQKPVRRSARRSAKT